MIDPTTECVCGEDPIFCSCRLGNVAVTENGTLVVLYDQET